MHITVMETVNRVDSQREVHHLSARKEMEEEYKRRERILNGEMAEAIGGGQYRPLDRLQDPNGMRQEMKDYKRNYERGMPIKLAPNMENELWKKAKRLKDEFVIGMVPQKDMHPVKARSVITKDGAVVKWVADYDKMRDTKSIERNQSWLKVNQPKLDEFKRIMRMLEPDNPNIANYERFRPS